MITIEVNGVSYDGFTQVIIKRGFTNLANTFSFQSTDLPVSSYPIKQGDSCVIKVDGESVINGFIEKTSIRIDSQTHMITFEGRDITADVIDSTLSGDNEFTGNIDLPELCRRILKKLNLSKSIKVVADTQTPKLTVASASTGQTAFKFLSKYANQQQVILNTDGSGNIVITRPTAETIGTNLRMIQGDNSNNILSATSKFDDTKRFNIYFMSSQANPSFIFDKAGNIEAKDVVKKFGKSLDNDIRDSRQFFVVADNPNDNETIAKRTEWEANFRRSQSFSYTCVVQGFSYEEGSIWTPNLKVPIDDDISDVHGVFFLDSVQYSLSVQGGSKTKLKFVTEDAYQLQAEKQKRTAQTSSSAGKYDFSKLFPGT